MWIQGNYRRVFLDMHIDDWNEKFLSKLDPPAIVAMLKDAGAQCLAVKAKSHTGLCYWPSSIGRMHKGLKGRDYVGEMTSLCHKNGLAVQGYYSNIFDNWAYLNHPSWRCVRPDGKTTMEQEGSDGRYGLVCPNHPEYRDYVRLNLQELVTRYPFDGIFLDMPFWTEVCYCASCKDRFWRETGAEIPRIVNWDDAQWRLFQTRREAWLAEFLAFSTHCIHDLKPDITVEHNFAVNCFPWFCATTDAINEASDYAGGDLYGGLLEESFICKYYRNVSRNLPFVFITSRCDPNLRFHTTTKTREELTLHGAISLAHGGAFSICDGINPDGSCCPDVYSKVVKKSFAHTQRYEPYAGGKLEANVAVWFSSTAKFHPSQNGKRVGEPGGKEYLDGPLGMVGILRDNHIPFDVVASKNLGDLQADVLVLSGVAAISDGEMRDIEAFVQRGGHLYVSGIVGHPRLAEMLNVDLCGMTEETFTYMNPTAEGREAFEDFSALNPLSFSGQQVVLNLKAPARVLAHTVLPYTKPGTRAFSAIHSDPPGEENGHPAAFEIRHGKGRILYVAAPIETMKPYMCRKTVKNLILSLCGELKFTAHAPASAEILSWRKENRRFFAILNEQETMPPSPLYEVFIEVPAPVHKAVLLGNGEECRVKPSGSGARIYLPKIDLFEMVEVF